jgi:hypothetical protein
MLCTCCCCCRRTAGGRGEATVYRDKVTGKIITAEEYTEQVRPVQQPLAVIAAMCTSSNCMLCVMSLYVLGGVLDYACG